MVPQDPTAALGRAEQLSRAGEHAAALELARQLTWQDPNNARAHQLVGALLSPVRPVEAVPSLRRALVLQPDLVLAHNQLGNSLTHLGDPEAALRCYETALLLDPSYAPAHFNRALTWLKLGRFRNGWVDYEWRWQMKSAPQKLQIHLPRWEGSPLAGRSLLIHTEQGMGDVFQLMRFLPEVRRRGVGRLVFACQKPLWPLLRGQVDVDEWFPIDEPSPITFDLYCSLLSLPGALRMNTEEDLRCPGPYVAADPARVDRWRERLQGLQGFKVGLCWQGSRTYATDAMRSIPLAEYAPLALSGVSLVSLQVGYGVEQIEPCREQVPLTVLERLDADGAFLDTAAVMANLDLVVTSDTAIAHLAGAMGRPVWVMLSTAADWRWMHGRSDSPWYSTMRLFRQRRFGDWPGAFQEARQALRQEGQKKRAANVAGQHMPRVPMGVGELVDKLTILAIKQKRFTDPVKRENVRREEELLQTVLAEQVNRGFPLEPWRSELQTVNEQIWDGEADIRECERQGQFGERFVELVRLVSRLNDRRAELTRQLNQAVAGISEPEALATDEASS